MTEQIDSNRIRNTAEDVYMDRIRQNTGRGRYLAIAAIVVITLFWLLVSCSAIAPASAQQPIVTPYPGPIATATAAAQQVTDAEAQRAEGQRKVQQGQEQQALADAKIRTAQQDAAAARAALEAQQYQAALEAVNRAEANVNEAQAQMNASRTSCFDVQGIIDAQAAKNISQTMEIQQLRVDKQTIQAAFEATIDRQEQNDRNSTALRIFGALVVLTLMAMIFIAIRDRVRARVVRSDAGAPPRVTVIEQYEDIES